MYRGGKFTFSFNINTNYPHEPPKVKCIPKVSTFTSRHSYVFQPLTRPQIYHPNVDLEGNVCLNILREDWKPVLNLNSVMVGLQYLFLEPNAEDPLNKGSSPSPAADSFHLWLTLPDSSRGCRRPAEEPRRLHPERQGVYAGRLRQGHSIRECPSVITLRLWVSFSACSFSLATLPLSHASYHVRCLSTSTMASA